MGEKILLIVKSIVWLVLGGVALNGIALGIVWFLKEVTDYYKNKKGDRNA